MKHSWTCIHTRKNITQTHTNTHTGKHTKWRPETKKNKKKNGFSQFKPVSGHDLELWYFYYGTSRHPQLAPLSQEFDEGFLHVAESSGIQRADVSLGSQEQVASLLSEASFRQAGEDKYNL